MIKRYLHATRDHVKRRIWIISDLQQSIPQRAEYCMTSAVADFKMLDLPLDAVCYLGDSVEGGNLDFIHSMTDMQVRELNKIDAPKYYVIGNHDFDYFLNHQSELTRMCIPFNETVSRLPDWHVSPTLQSLSFSVDFPEFTLFFLPDHSAEDGNWFTSHGEIHGDAAQYPYSVEDYKHVCDQIAGVGKPVFTLSHYAYPGGNRQAPLFERFLPLPDNLVMHFYGHAHIGDAVWVGKDRYRQITAVDHQSIVQIDVASLENFRGSAIRSVILEYYDNGDIGVLFRNHTRCEWDNLFTYTKRVDR